MTIELDVNSMVFLLINFHHQMWNLHIEYHVCCLQNVFLQYLPR